MGQKIVQQGMEDAPEYHDSRQEREDFVLYELLCLRCDRDPAAEPRVLRRAREHLRRELYAGVPQ